MYINTDNTTVLGNQIEWLIEIYEKLAIDEIRAALENTPTRSIRLDESIWCDFWNRGFSMEVKEVKLGESDDTVMVVGSYCSKENDEEFFSYISSFHTMKQIVDQIEKIVYGTYRQF